jgi:AcrR family transcriptional regulator
MNTETRPTRQRNAGASRDALLDAARALFSERGYDQTTVRDIGERAGIDQALIARYFGNKLKLYLAALAVESADTVRTFETTGDYVDWFLGRVDRFGPGPIMQAVVRSDTTAEIRQATGPHMRQRIVAPLAALFASRGFEHATARAEIAVAGLFGILVVRATGSLEHVQSVERGELARVLTAVLDATASA